MNGASFPTRKLYKKSYKLVRNSACICMCIEINLDFGLSMHLIIFACSCFAASFRLNLTGPGYKLFMEDGSRIWEDAEINDPAIVQGKTLVICQDLQVIQLPPSNIMENHKVKQTTQTSAPAATITCSPGHVQDTDLHDVTEPLMKKTKFGEGILCAYMIQQHLCQPVHFVRGNKASYFFRAKFHSICRPPGKPCMEARARTAMFLQWSHGKSAKRGCHSSFSNGSLRSLYNCVPACTKKVSPFFFGPCLNISGMLSFPCLQLQMLHEAAHYYKCRDMSRLCGQRDYAALGEALSKKFPCIKMIGPHGWSAFTRILSGRIRTYR